LTSSDFTATNGTTVVLTVGTMVGNIVDIIKYTSGIVNSISGTGTTNELAYFTASTTIASLTTATYPSLTEISYVKGVTSSIQTQLNGKQSTLTNPVTGTGTTNYLPKFTGSTSIGNSQVIDNGAQVGIGLTPNASYGTLQIKSPASVYSIDLVGRSAGLNSENQITFWNSTQSTGLAYIYNSLSNLYIGTGANQPFTLSTGGNFIFGSTIDNGAKLQVSGTAAISSNLTAGGVITSTSGVTMSGGWVRNTLLQSAFPVQVFDSNYVGTSRFAAIGYDRTGGMAFWVNSTTIDVTSNSSVFYLANTGEASFSSSVRASSLALSGTIANSGDAATLTIKQASTTFTNGIYLERAGERNGYYMYIGGGLDALTFRRNYFGTQSDVMSLTRDGKVGIGTSSPESKFQVNDGTNINLAIKVGQTDTSAVMLNAYNDAASANIPLEFRASKFAFQNGNVGIGTASPTNPLVIQGSNTAPQFRIIRSESTSQGMTIVAGGGETTFNSIEGSNVIYGEYVFKSTKGTNTIERVRINSSGDLVVTGTVANISILGDGAQMHFGRNNTNYIIANGGTSSTIRIISNTNGVELSNGATSWVAVSDENLKEMSEWKPFENSVEKILSLRAGTSRYKTDKEGTSRSFLIAQDVKKVLPEAVSTYEDGTLGLRYTELIPMLVGAIQELQAKLDKNNIN